MLLQVVDPLRAVEQEGVAEQERPQQQQKVRQLQAVNQKDGPRRPQQLQQQEVLLVGHFPTEPYSSLLLPLPHPTRLDPNRPNRFLQEAHHQHEPPSPMVDPRG